MSDSFIRARSPAQKSKRQAQILAAATRVLLRQGIDATTMADMAAEAEMVRSAFYRYFKSKEEILVHVLVAQAEEMSTELQAALAGAHGLAGAAAPYAHVCANRPLFCALTADLARTLESNIAFDRLVIIKQELARIRQDWVQIMVSTGIVTDPRAAAGFLRNAYVILAGLWPVTHGREVMHQAAIQAGLDVPFADFQTEFSALLQQLARGMDAPEPARSGLPFTAGNR